jgi:hypothetical protein
MITLQDLTDLIKEYKDDYHDALPGYQSYSRTLKKNIPGKTQLRTSFIDNLNEYKILSDDETVCAKIEAMLKKYA